MIVIVFGLPGPGKSYFASRLATLTRNVRPTIKTTNEPMTRQQVDELISQGRFPGEMSRPDLTETHISWVILGSRTASGPAAPKTTGREIPPLPKPTATSF